MGGTWDTFGMYRSLTLDGSEPAADEVPQGVGQISRCAISNNGRYGISARVRGRREDDLDPSDAFSAAACRIANSIIWNNAAGGYRAWLEEFATGVGSPTLLTPIVHCTIVGNGEASGANAELTDGNGGTTSSGKFEYASGLIPGTPSEVIVCRFNDSIFQRKVASAEDFGPYLLSVIERDDQNPSNVLDAKLGVEACRYMASGGTPGYTVYSSVDISSAFQGPVNWTSLAASQFYLANTGPSSELDHCIPWNEAAPVESARDYTDFARTGVLTDRDIGA